MYKNRRYAYIIFVCVLVSSNFVFGQSWRYPGYSSGPGITGFFDVNDTTSVHVIDRINQYSVMRYMLNLTYLIEDAADNRIHFEFHVGTGPSFDTENDTTILLQTISFKFNLMNPKIPNSRDILDDIHELQHLSDMTGFQLPPRAEERVDRIEERLEKYNKQFWWKRLSLNATIPMTSFGYSPDFDYDRTYLCLGYDIGDVVTLQFGANRHKELLVAASVDLSTPLYSLAEDFKYMISRLLNLPMRREYEYYYW